jgi:hypothetical protein
MYRTMVAGCNGYERGRGAVSLAHAVASATGARLVLVGVHHNILEGDHAMQVLHGAACVVAIAPDPLAPHPELQRIGVGIDATPESERALAMARDLAERTGARLWLRRGRRHDLQLGRALPDGRPPGRLREDHRVTGERGS